MRKVAFVREDNPIRKLIIFESTDGVYLFGYDYIEDGPCIWDLYFPNVEEAEDSAIEHYGISNDDWIDIADPVKGSQHDLISNHHITEKSSRIGAWTGNERLFLTGLMNEFESSKINSKQNAVRILKALKFDDQSIKLMVN